jgi:2-polyprenyl-6-methoxyphenol hydroxylase-like FAD-dependent oxidoreductase
MQRTQVLIVGAGPTGLVLALWLAKLGVSVRIVDKTEAPGATSRALAVQARTLELYRQLDLAEPIVERGHKTPAVNLWVKGRRAARVPFETIGEELTPYPFLKIFPQDEHEKLLVARLADLGVAVERRTELVSFVETGAGVAARLRGPGVAEQTGEAAYIVGCDGARSTVRSLIGAGFPGGTYQQAFYVADIDGAGPSLDGELHVDLDEADFLAVFPLSGEGRARLIGTVSDERAPHADQLKFEDVSSRAIEHMKVEVRKVNWFSTYRVHHRVTEHFRHGRAFLAGDAAHIHSPVGGQGMNTGIGDAINLAWKLAAVLAGRAPDGLLDSYEPERIAFAKRLVGTTDRIFSFVNAEGPAADFIRTRLAPLVIPAALSQEAVREYLFRSVSQITLNYREGPLAVGKAGRVHGGDRLPWSPTATADEAAALARTDWQVLVFGHARPDASAWCERRGVPLTELAFTDAHGHAGLARDATYLLRPDTYVALAAEDGPAEALDRYFAERRIQPGAMGDVAVESTV